MYKLLEPIFAKVTCNDWVDTTKRYKFYIKLTLLVNHCSTSDFMLITQAKNIFKIVLKDLELKGNIKCL